jgi:transcriptional regulator with XRE-family HTH domain
MSKGKFYDVGKGLRTIRRLSGKTQPQVGDVLGMFKQQLSDYENNKYEPKLDTIYRIVKACGYEMEDFFKHAKIKE